jgi:myo-inositol-1(or 4)-monophosphatase
MLTDSAEERYLARMHTALVAATEAARQFVPGGYDIQDDGSRNVTTEVDRRLSDVLRECLLERGEGWLSEEDPDDLTRLSKDVVWIVDPLDGTREYVDGIPEWSISIGLTIGGLAVAGAISNPMTGELFLGAPGYGVIHNGRRVQTRSRPNLDGALILASRQEYLRDEWRSFEGKGFAIRPTGSTAYKLALVAAGLADATWTLSPKHEWDIAAGVALMNAAAGNAGCLHDTKLQFNRQNVLIPNLVASGRDIWDSVLQVIYKGVETKSGIRA